MPIRFATLASGSKGNCALVEYAGRFLMIDIGLAPNSLLGRLRKIGVDISAVSEVVLTHTHGDHINDRSLEILAAQGIPLRCHASHANALAAKSGFAELTARSLVLPYEDSPFPTFAGLNVHPVRVRHGAGRTYGFRITGHDRETEHRTDLGYVADLGCWNDQVAAHFRNCAILAVEFNHDVRMTIESRRHFMVKQRNLSNDGHLSNVQARDLVRSIVAKSDRTRPEHLVLLHISEDCNTHEIAIDAARDALGCSGAIDSTVLAAPQREPLEWLSSSMRSACISARTGSVNPDGSPCPTDSLANAATETLMQQEFRFPV
ncbi:MBL fold metallo-hydrolase [bacterium]|nr:MBL fold metallo-hydrolase [bacterium]